MTIVKKKSGVWLATLICVVFLPLQAQALSLSFVSAFDFEDPDGVAFDPMSGNLFVVSGAPDSTVTEVTTTGGVVSSFPTTGFPGVQGISINPGIVNTLLVPSQDDIDSAVGEFTKAGVFVPSPPGIGFPIGGISEDADGIIFHTPRNSIFTADDADEAIYEFSTAGVLLNTILTEMIDPDFDEPHGITFDPLTGNLLVVDDGTSSLFELTPTGGFVMKTDLLALSGFDDPEGVTIDRANNKLYVAFTNEGKIGEFNIINSVPVPSTILLLGAGGLAWLGGWRFRKKT